MQTLDISKSKKFQFEVNINGINPDELKGLFEFIIGDVHYGFPVEIKDSNIKVDIPPLTEIVKKNITSGSILECNLSVYGNGFHLEPWNGKFEAMAPVQMEAHMSFTEEESEKVIEEKVEEKQTVEVKLIEEKEELPEPNLDIEELTEMPGPSPIRVEKTKKQKQQSKQNLTELMKTIIKEELTYIKTGKRINDISKDSSVKRNIRIKVRKKLIESFRKKDNNIISEQKECDCDVKDPKKLMESAGMTNEKTQKRLLEAAKAKAGDDPVSIYDTIKKMIELTDKR